MRLLTKLAELRALCTLASTRLTHHWYVTYKPYPSSIRAFCAFTLINRCPVLLQLKSKIYFVRALQLTIQLWSLSSLLFYHIKLCYILFFFHFKPFIRPLFIQLFCNNIFTFSVLFFFFETNLTNIQYSYI